jgi:hypothetical protein
MSAQYGETSKEAVKAAQAAAQLKDQIAFSKDLVDAFNPDAKFNALTKSVGGVLDGFQAFEGALGLVGASGEQVQATMLKVQSAMALSQGIQGVFEAKDAFMQLGTVLKTTAIGQALLTAATAAYTFVTTATTTAVKLFRIALISTGIGALVVGVGLLVANFDSIVGVVKKVVGWFGGLSGTVKNILSVMFPFIGVIRLVIAGLEAMGIIDNEQERIKKENHEKEMKRVDAELKKQGEMRKAREKNFNSEQANYDRAIKLAQAEGKSVTELQKAKINASIKYQETRKKELEQDLVAYKFAQKFLGELGENLIDTTDIEAKIAELGNNILDQKNDLKILDIEAKKAAAGTGGGSSGGSGGGAAKEKLDITRKLKDDELRILEDGFDKEMALLNEKRKREKEDAEKQFKEGVLKKEDYNKLLTSIDTTYEADRKKIYEKNTAEQIKTRDFNIENLIESKIKEGDIEIEAAAKKIELDKKTNEELKAIQIERIKSQTDMALKIAKTFSDVYNSLNGLMNASDNERLKGVEKGSKAEEEIKKRMFKRDKKLRIVQTIIDTASNVVTSVRNGGGIPTGIPFGIAAAAMGGLQLAAISKAKFQGEDGGGGEKPTPPAAMTAQFNTVGNNGINQLAQLQQQPTMAYVVSGQVTSQQALDRNRAQNSSL